jgi:hypothetical protein
MIYDTVNAHVRIPTGSNKPHRHPQLQDALPAEPQQQAQKEQGSKRGEKQHQVKASC